jgi:hypothetical protein
MTSPLVVMHTCVHLNNMPLCVHHGRLATRARDGKESADRALRACISKAKDKEKRETAAARKIIADAEAALNSEKVAAVQAFTLACNATQREHAMLVGKRAAEMQPAQDKIDKVRSLVREAESLLSPRAAVTPPSSAFRSLEHTCPITNDVMSEPTILRCGHTFEKTVIAQWGRVKGTCPVCLAPFEESDMIPNRGLKAVIETWTQANS